MRHIALLPLLLALALLPGCNRPVADAARPDSAKAVQIDRAEFGLFKIEDGKASFTPSNVVPLSVNQAYGWVVTLRTHQEKVRWREEFTLPAAPVVWGDVPPASREISVDGKTSILEKEVALQNGTIFNSWAVAAGDPPGRYTIRLTVADAEPIVFAFEVRAP